MSFTRYRTSVVTGASAGIGRALAVALAKRGWKVGILDIDMEGAQETLSMVSRAGGDGEVFRCDVCRLEDVEKAAAHFFDLWGGVGLLINNAGIGMGGYIGSIPMEAWEKVVAVDYWGVVYGCHAFIPRMKAQGGGHIANTSSMAGLIAVPQLSPYCTCKAAVVALSETLLVELAPFNIGVSVICPPTINTGVLDHSLETVSIEGVEGLEWGMDMIRAAMENSKLTAEDFAERVLDSIEKNKLYVLADRMSWGHWLRIRIAPSGNYKGLAFLNKHGLARHFMMFMARRGLV